MSALERVDCVGAPLTLAHRIPSRPMERLDRRVHTELSARGESSRRLAQRLIERGDVRVDGVVVRRVSTLVDEHATLEITLRRSRSALYTATWIRAPQIP